MLAGRPSGRVRFGVRRARQQSHGLQLPAAAHGLVDPLPIRGADLRVTQQQQVAVGQRRRAGDPRGRLTSTFFDMGGRRAASCRGPTVTIVGLYAPFRRGGCGARRQAEAPAPP